MSDSESKVDALVVAIEEAQRFIDKAVAALGTWHPEPQVVEERRV